MQDTYEKNKYIFVSYAHKDASVVLPLIDALRKNGYTVWYDQGIEAGTEWPEYIAKRIEECGVFLACISPASMQSHNCRNEINFALSLKKECLTIYLEETKMTAGMQLQLGSLQALFRYRHPSDESFYHALIHATLLQHLASAPAPVKPKVLPAAPAPQAVEESIAVSEKNPSKKASRMILKWLVFCIFLLGLDYTIMWLSTKYIENGFLMTLAATFPVLILGEAFMSYTKKQMKTFSGKEQMQVIEMICIFVVFSFLFSAIGDCFFIFCTTKVIYKILISLGINLFRYFILLGTTPDGPKNK